MAPPPSEDETDTLETRGGNTSVAGGSSRAGPAGQESARKPTPISLLGKSNIEVGRESVDRDDLGALSEDLSETSQLSNSVTHAEEPEDLTCPITKMMFLDPVFVAGSGNTYERNAIETFWRTRRDKRDPLTNENIKNVNLFTNWTKRREVDAWLTRHPEQTPEGWTSRQIPHPKEEKDKRRNRRGGSDANDENNNNNYVNKVFKVSSAAIATVAVLTTVFLATTAPAPPPGFPQFPPGVVASTLKGSGVTGMPAPPAWYAALRQVKPPSGSRIVARRGSRGALEIVIPPATGGTLGGDALAELGFAATWAAFTGMWTVGAFRGPTPAVALFSVPFWGVSAHLGKSVLSAATETTRVVFYPPSDSETMESSGDVPAKSRDGTFRVSWEAFGRAVGSKHGSLNDLDGAEIVTRAYVNGVPQTGVELRQGVNSYNVGKGLHHAEQSFVSEIISEALIEAKIARDDAKHYSESHEAARDTSDSSQDYSQDTLSDVSHSTPETETIHGDTHKVPLQAKL